VFFFSFPVQPALFYQTDCSVPSRRPFAVTGAGDRAQGTGSRTEGVTGSLYFAKILFVL